MTTTKDWTQWEKQVINGVFPLHRAVSHSDHSAVFLTEHPRLSLPNVLLKLVPAIPTLRDTQLAYWDTAATLTHPNLIRLHEAGRCQLGGLQFLFVVMEYAQQTLARFLSEQTLAPSALETALGPTLSSLGFLHRNQLVHGGLKPSNVLLVNRQLKLASDTVRPAGEATASIAAASPYDPPEARDGSCTAAGDIWSLGVIMVEALTRNLPSWPDRDAATVRLPPTLPARFEAVIRQCLNRDPAKRPTVSELEEMLPTQTPQSPPKIGAQMLAMIAEESVHYPVLLPPATDPAESTDSLLLQPDSVPAAPPRQPGKYPRPLAMAAMTLIGLAVGSLGAWSGLRLLDGQTPLAAAATVSPAVATVSPTAAPVSEAVAAGSLPATEEAPSPVEADPSAPPNSSLHEAPDVPPNALKTIHGHIKFALRLRIDSSGEVTHVVLASRGPSKYFTRLAMQTARNWKFVTTDDPRPRLCLVWFDFTRRGAVAYSDLSFPPLAS